MFISAKFGQINLEKMEKKKNWASYIINNFSYLS